MFSRLAYWLCGFIMGGAGLYIAMGLYFTRRKR